MSNLAIATNIAGINAHRSLRIVSEKGAKASEKLSSGFRINRAADDAAGLAISEKIRNQISGLNQAQRNVENGISLIQTAEGGMQEIGEMIKRQRELIIQGMNDTVTSEDRQKIHTELDQLSAEITETAYKTEYNQIPLLTTKRKDPQGTGIVSNYASRVAATPPFTNSYWGVNHVDFNGVGAPPGQSNIGTITILNGEILSINQAVNSNIEIVLTSPDGSTVTTIPPTGSNQNFTAPGVYQVAINNTSATPQSFGFCTFLGVGSRVLPETPGALWIQSGANDNQGMWVDRYDCRAETLGIDGLLTEPRDVAENSLGRVDAALEWMNSNRANAGAQQNRLEFTGRNLGVSSENLSAAESRIRDTDMAKEMMEFTKANILSQSGMSMLAQANQSPNQILSLLR